MDAHIRDDTTEIRSGLPPKIEYSELNARQEEVYNFQKVAGLLADYGFNCIKLADDWLGADFLAYHKDGETTLKVQLKSRFTIHQKYVGRGLHVAFPVGAAWYIVDHDVLVEMVGQHTSALTSTSWLGPNGSYHYAKGPKLELLTALTPYRLEP